MATSDVSQSGTIGLKRSLRFWDLVLYGIILIQPTAPMPVFGVLYDASRGHVVTVILLAMVAMLFTSISYGRRAPLQSSSWRGGMIVRTANWIMSSSIPGSLASSSMSRLERPCSAAAAVTWNK